MKYVIAILSLFFGGCATQVTGRMALDGGASAVRVSESKYEISVYLNGFTAGSTLKPILLERAKIIANENGFASFEIENYTVDLFQPDRKFNTIANVRFYRKPLLEVAGKVYSIGSESLAPYRTSIDKVSAVGYSQIRSLRQRDAKGVFIGLEPTFIDSVSSTKNLWEDDITITFVRPGVVSFDVWANVSKGFFGRSSFTTLEMMASLKPGKVYVLAGRFAKSRLEYWLEDQLTKEIVSEVQTTPIIID